jgi:hypothetical protein
MKPAALACAVLFAGIGCQNWNPFAACPASTPIAIGSWWVEVGGPSAHFNIKPDTLSPGPQPWLVIARIDPDARAIDDLAVYLDRVDGDQRVDARVDSRMNPAGVFNGAERAPQLPGGWYLVEMTIPSEGCWRVVATVDNAEVGSAVIELRGE